MEVNNAWPVLEIVLEGMSELVEFVGSVLYSAPKGFLPVLTFGLKLTFHDLS